MTVFADLYELPERDRIDVIGKAASGGALVAFVVDDAAKADRYIQQLQKRFKVCVIERGAGPVKNTVVVKVGPLGN